MAFEKPHLKPTDLERLIGMERALDKAHAHLEGCTSCRDAYRQMLLRSDADSDRALKTLLLGAQEAESACPDPEELARHAEGKNSPFERDMIALHLEDCPTCREELAALQALFQTMEADLPAEVLADLNLSE